MPRPEDEDDPAPPEKRGTSPPRQRPTPTSWATTTGAWFLTWNMVDSDTASDTTGYRIERWRSNTGVDALNDSDWVYLTTVDDATSYTDDDDLRQDEETRMYASVRKPPNRRPAWVMMAVDYALHPETHDAMPPELVAPDSVTAVIDETDQRLDDVIVTWTGGSGPEGTKVAIGIFTRDFSTFLTDRTVNDAMGGTHKFDDLPDGEYVIVVATYHPDDLTVGAGKRSNVIVVPGS